MRVPFRFSNIAERVAWTAVQSFLGAWAVTSTLTVDQAKASALAGAAAAISAVFTTVKAVIVDLKPKTTAPLSNIVQRVGWTFASAIAGILPVTLTVDELSVGTGEALLTGALGAGAAAVIALAKNLALEGAVTEATRRSGDTLTPTDLP